MQIVHIFSISATFMVIVNQTTAAFFKLFLSMCQIDNLKSVSKLCGFILYQLP